MDTLRAMLSAYLQHSLIMDDFADQFIDAWNDIRLEQNKAIESSGIRSTLDNLWAQYKAGELDEVDYGMQWTATLNTLENVRILPQSIVFTIGNEIYNLLILYKESDHLSTQEIPTEDVIRAQSQHLLETIDD